MLQTLERTNIFDARVLTAAHADALRALAGPGGLPLLPCLHPALEEGQIVGDYAGQDELQAAALLPLYAEDPLPTSLRAAGYGADGQGAVLTPPILREDYTQLRHFLRLALRWATERYASYHVWAVLPLDLEHPDACDDLCAQYLSAVRPLQPVRRRKNAMDYSEAKKLVKARLSEKRWTHTKNVKKMAVKLAKRWGTDPEKAAMAAILHDSAKELPKQELLQIFADNAIIAENAPARPSPVWHGIAAAILAETQWGITDPEILSAIRCHTTGKPGMSKLDKIIYLADMTSAERDWPGVDDLRALEMQDLDRALCDALKRSIDFVEEKGGSLDPESVAAYEYAKAHLE